MEQDSDRALYWIGLAGIPGVGRVTFRKLISAFGSPRAALDAAAGDLQACGVSDKVAQTIRSHPWGGNAEAELERARHSGVSIIVADDEAFPGALRSIPDPPLLLYVKGNILRRDADAVAVVGTRTPTHYGLRLTRGIATELASANVTVVSGMARGIDTEAHAGALAAGGRTIAVLACGIDIAYPPENSALMEQIADAGAVVSENPFGTLPESGYFPARNRIISGLSQGTVVIEAAEDSGSLITANYALQQGRMLFAVPGSAGTRTSRGPHNLIRQGAVLVESAADILSRLGAGRAATGRTCAATMPQPELPPEEQTVLSTLSVDPRHIDEILAATALSAGRLSGLLTSLELKGLVKQLPGKYFMREPA